MNLPLTIKWLLLAPLILFGLALLVLLPFIVLIKGAVISYDNGFSTTVAVLIGSIGTFIVILVYLVAIDRMSRRRRFRIPVWVKLTVAGAIVVGFSANALFVLADQNVKSRKIAKGFTKVHPILRIGVSTWSVFDPGLVITDMTRKRKDYHRMHTRVYNKSMHFTQADGYVHAIDLRTKRRSRIRNWITQTVFRMMGFGTLRHNGTADHLHVQLGMSKKHRMRGLNVVRNRARKNRRKRRYRKRIRKYKTKSTVARKKRILIKTPVKRVKSIPAKSSGKSHDTGAGKLDPPLIQKKYDLK